MLTKAIQFRHLISQLTNEERLTFLSNLLNSHTDVILSGLFCHFMQSNSNQIDVLNEFNNSVSNIIQERKDKPKVKSILNIKLHHLPRAIIGYTASYLHQRYYIDFSMSNRAIYLGCNSPNVLQQLVLDGLEDYSRVSLSSFRSVIKLRIDPRTAIKLESCTAPIFNQITTLELRAHESSGWIQEFLDRNIVNYDTVTQLRCYGFGSDDADIERDAFLNLLKQCSNLKHLKLTYCCYMEGTITADDIAAVCPHLIGLYLYGAETNKNALIRIFSPKLKYLSFGVDSEQEALDFDSVSFDKVEELCIATPTKQSVDDILKSASDLKKIFLNICSKYCDGSIEQFMNKHEIKHLMENVILQSPLMTYMRYRVQHNDFLFMIEGIECGLFQTKTRQRKELKIEINVQMDDVPKSKTKEFACEVDRVINLLEASAIDDFMFIVAFKGDAVNDFKPRIFQDLCNLSVNTNVFDCKYHHTLTAKKKYKFVIYNQNCKINGFRDKVCGFSSYIR